MITPELSGHEDQVAAKKTIVDVDGDNPITAEPGSAQAKLQWNDVWNKAHSPEAVAKGKELHPDAVGIYKGKALVPGPGENQGDAQLFKDKLMYCNGFSPEVANKIVGKYISKFTTVK
jgi:hypothetical protein